jgi:hypothetical protein
MAREATTRAARIFDIKSVVMTASPFFEDALPNAFTW